MIYNLPSIGPKIPYAHISCQEIISANPYQIIMLRMHPKPLNISPVVSYLLLGNAKHAQLILISTLVYHFDIMIITYIIKDLTASFVLKNIIRLYRTICLYNYIKFYHIVSLYFIICFYNFICLYYIRVIKQPREYFIALTWLD